MALTIDQQLQNFIKIAVQRDRTIDEIRPLFDNLMTKLGTNYAPDYLDFYYLHHLKARDREAAKPPPVVIMPTGGEPEYGDKLLPADRQDIIQEFLDSYPEKIFRREDLQAEFTFSRDQTQRALRQLKQAGRIGHREERERLPNAQNPHKPFFRSDAVYFSLKAVKTTQPTLTFPITVNNLEELQALLEVVKTLA